MDSKMAGVIHHELGAARAQSLEVTEDDVVSVLNFSVRLPSDHARRGHFSPWCWRALPVNRLRLAP
jgi:hypothetical protein